VRIEGEVVIIRPVDQVFDFVADERNEPRYNSRMLRADKTSPGPIGRGSRFLAESAMLGRVVETTIEFTDYERPRLLGSMSRSVVRLIKPVATEIEGTLTFDAVAGGTRMRWAWDVETRGVLKLMSRIVAGERQEETMWGNLKHLLEEQPMRSSSRGFASGSRSR
jgi:hypothetical protein